MMYRAELLAVAAEGGSTVKEKDLVNGSMRTQAEWIPNQSALGPARCSRSLQERMCPATARLQLLSTGSP